MNERCDIKNVRIFLDFPRLGIHICTLFHSGNICIAYQLFNMGLKITLI